MCDCTLNLSIRGNQVILHAWNLVVPLWRPVKTKTALMDDGEIFADFIHPCHVAPPPHPQPLS